MGIYSTVRSVRWALVGYPARRIAKLLKTSEQWSREQLEDFRDKKLRDLFNHCYENVPYYRELMDESGIQPTDIKTIGDLEKLPLLTKELVRQNSKRLLARNVSKMKTTWFKTGGTTGEPMHICKDHECAAWESMCFERGLSWGGVSADDPRISLFGGSLGLDKASSASRFGNSIRGDLFLPAFELRSDTAMSYFERIRRSRSHSLIGYPSAVYRLAVLAEEMNQNIQLDVVFPTAEMMLPEWERTISKAFRCRILPFYGCGEVNSLGYSQPDCQGYFIPEEHATIEVLQEDGTTSEFGEGRFVITSLDNYAMPTLRYLNGDMGKISPSVKGGLPFSKIERLDGRFNSLLMTDSGDLISGVIGTHVFRHFSSVQNYQIVQEEPLRLVIRIVPRDNFAESHQVQIKELFARHLGNRMDIQIEKVSEIPFSSSGKTIFVINRCLHDSSNGRYESDKVR